MTGNSDLRERLGAVFFALIMVTSMVAAGVAFTGNVAAATPPDVSAAATDFVNGSASQTLGGSGTNSLNVSEGASDVGSFGSSGSASIAVPDGVTFNQSESNLAVRQVNNGSVSNVRFTDASTIEFDYTTSSGQTDFLFADVIIDVAPSFTSGDLTATVGVESNTLALNGKAATLSTTQQTVARGNTQTGSQTLTIDGDSVNGQHAQGENITISVPSDANFSFDTSQSLTVSGDKVTNNDPVAVSSNKLEFNLTGGDLASGDSISISNVQFNVSGDSDSTTDSEFTDRVELTTIPVDSTGTVTTSSDTSNLDVQASTAQLMSGVTLAAGGTQQGSANIRVFGNDTGDIIGQDTNVTVSIPADTGVTFDTANQPSVDAKDGNDPQLDTPSFVDERTVTAAVTGSSSSSGDWVALTGVQFNTTTDASVSNLNLTVETTAAGTNAESVQVNTSTGTTNFINVVKPAVKTHAGNDLTIFNDKNGELQVDPGSASTSDEVSSNEDNDIVVTSQASGDIVDSSEGTNVTVRIPSGSAITFDQSVTSLDTSQSTSDNTLSATIVDDRTINITAPSESVNGDEEFVVRDVQYNVSGGTTDAVQFTAEVNRTSVTSTSANYINVSQLTEDKLQGDAEGPGVDSYSTDSDEETGINVGTTQTAGVRALNASNSDFPYGGATVDLTVTGTPDGASATLNTSSVTTREDGSAAFNITLGDTKGYYNVTASLAQNSSKNVTLRWDATAGSATQVNVTKVKDGIAGGSTGSAKNSGEAVFRVRIEDSGGNLVSGQDVDAGLVIGGNAQLVAGYEDVASDLSETSRDSSPLDNPGSGTFRDSDGDSRVDYLSGQAGTDNGEFFISLSDSTEESVTLEVNPESDSISSDSASADFYTVRNVNVALNNTTTTTTSLTPVGATATMTNGNEAVTVPNVTTTFGLSNSSVGTLNSGTAETDFNGEATVTVTADTQGTTDVEALIRNKQGTAQLDVSDPTYGITGVSLTPNTVTANTTVDHTLTYTVDAASNDNSADTYTVTLPSSASFTSANSLNVTDATGQTISTTSGPSIGDANNGTNNQLTFDVAPDSNFDTSAVNVDANVSVSFPDVSSSTTADVTLNVSDSSQGTTNASTPVTIEPAVTAPSPVVENGSAPTDVDGDGTFEDVNGNGEFDIVDVNAIFQNRDSDAVQNNTAAFDYNGNGEFDIVDINRLFQQAQEA